MRPMTPWGDVKSADIRISSKNRIYICDGWNMQTTAHTWSAMIEFVGFNHNETGNEEQHGGTVEDAVDVCTCVLLLCSLCWLDNEDGLDYEEDAS